MCKCLAHDALSLSLSLDLPHVPGVKFLLRPARHRAFQGLFTVVLDFIVFVHQVDV